jgi:hypothetical protein
VRYARAGSTLIDAWFPHREGDPALDQRRVGARRPERLCQGWVGRDGIDPSSDHAWGFGSVSADPTSPTWCTAMWTLC